MAAENEVPETLVCDVRAVTAPDLGTVEALVHLQVSVRDQGCTVHLRHPTPRMLELLEFCGLTDALAVCEESALVDEGQSEQGEQPLRVEEEVEPGDPAL